MKDAIQAAEFLVEQSRQFLEVLRSGHRQVDWRQGRFRAARGLDLVVDLFQLFRGATQQDDSGAVAGQGQGGTTPNAGAGAGNQNDAVLEGIGRALVSQCLCIHG